MLLLVFGLVGGFLSWCVVYLYAWFIETGLCNTGMIMRSLIKDILIYKTLTLCQVRFLRVVEPDWLPLACQIMSWVRAPCVVFLVVWQVRDVCNLLILYCISYPVAFKFGWAVQVDCRIVYHVRSFGSDWQVWVSKRMQSLLMVLTQFAVLGVAQDLNDLVKVLQIASLAPKPHLNGANTSYSSTIVNWLDLRLGCAYGLGRAKCGRGRCFSDGGGDEAGGLGNWGI